MPIPASIVAKKTYLARETTPGTKAPQNKFLQGLNIRVVGDSTRGEVRPSGSTMRTSRPLIQNWSTFTIAAGSYLDYNSIIYPLAGMLGIPTITTPGGGTLSREHAFTYAPDGSNVRPAFSLATGYTGGTAEETLRNIWQAFNFGFSRTAAPTIGGNGYGRDLNMSGSIGVNESQTLTVAASGGTFTVTYGGQTTSAQAYNVSAASLQTALRALTSINGANVTVTGGPGDVGGTTPYVITFIGTLANTDVALMTTDASSLTGGAHTATVVETQKGGITTVPVKAIQAPEWDVYADATVGALGTTRLRPYSVAFAFSGLVNPDWVIDSTTPSYDDDTLQVPTLTLNMVLRNDATARALYAALIAGATYYVRLKATGPLIEGALPYLLQLDCAVQADANLGQFGDQGGAETMPFPLTIVSDSTFASGGFQGLVRNILTQL